VIILSEHFLESATTKSDQLRGDGVHAMMLPALQRDDLRALVLVLVLALVLA